MALSLDHRLKKDKDFERLFKNGTGASSASISIKAARNQLSLSRFAFSISSRNVPKAVIRNTVKRILSGAIGANLRNIKKGFDIIIIVRKVPVDFRQALPKELSYLIKKIKIYE